MFMNYIGPGKKDNVKKSILNNINSILKKHTDYPIQDGLELFGWAISNNNRWGSYNLRKGDYIGIYQSGKICTELYIGKVLFMINSSELSEEIWGKDKNGKVKEKVIVFEKEKVFYEKRSTIWEVFNRGKKLQSFKSTEIDLSKIEEYMLEGIEKNSLKEKNNKIKINLLSKIEDIDNGKTKNINIFIKDIDEVDSNVNLKMKKKISKQARNTNYPRKLVGLYGEKIVYTYLKFFIGKKECNNVFFKRLNFSEEEVIEYIKFYNSNIEIVNGDFEDKSSGKGHDIKIITNIREIKLEVKSSVYKVGIFHLSYNELLDMKNGLDNNYIVIVDEILEQPYITIIKNFSNLYTDEAISMITKLSIDVSKIPNEYRV